MITQIYESNFIVNSFHALDANTKTVIAADDKGFISPTIGTRIIFPNPHDPNDLSCDLNTLVIKAGDTPVKVMVNDNDMYPLYVDANSMKGIEYIRVYSITLLSGTSFYFEGLSSES